MLVPYLMLVDHQGEVVLGAVHRIAHVGHFLEFAAEVGIDPAIIATQRAKLPS